MKYLVAYMPRAVHSHVLIVAMLLLVAVEVLSKPPLWRYDCERVQWTHTHTHTIWIPWLMLYLCKPGHGYCQYMVSQALISRWVLVGNLTLSLKARSLESSAVWRKVARRSSHNRQVAASQWPRICQLVCDLIFIILLIMLCALCLRDQL